MAAAETKILDAQFAEPTSRYDHAVLGPDAEWGALVIAYQVCPACTASTRGTVTWRLPPHRVFEDLTPRLWDLDRDGSPEVVVIESDAEQGARLAIYNAAGMVAATPFIGTRFRWLAPLGAADMDGDGVVEIAYIDRPHLAKTLRVWQFRDGALSQVAELPGLTNHRIGQAFISGGIRDCGDGPEIVTADSNWRQVMATRLEAGGLATRALARFNGQESFAAALACQ